MARTPVIFEAVAHPLRARILERLVERPASPSELARELGVSIGVASYHARRLEELGLTSVVTWERPAGRRGPPQSNYSADPLEVSDEDWMSIPAAIRSAIANAAFREVASTPPAGPRSNVPREPEMVEDADSQRIVERIQQGERKLAADLYKRYFARVYGYLCSLLDDQADAEDVTHQVFERMLQALSANEIRAAGSFRSWLFAVARTKAADHRRKHDRVDPTAPSEMTRRVTSLPRGSRESGHNLSAVFGADLAATLRRLPGLPREVVLLRYVGDFDLAEVAGIIGVSEDSVKQAHRRALTALRERLSTEPPD